MAEIKNTFLQSKMNQDVDDRIVPQGEYRSAQNISVSRSEGSDVGALQTVSGNSLVTAILPNIRNLDIIGQYADLTTNNFYIFLTDYIDSSPTGVNNFAPTTANCFIYRFNVSTKIATKLVEGYWLNFAKNNPITGINILENLLFWNDNRNQPRKINVDSAASPMPYYTNEDNISVAKYAPLLPIQLLDVANNNLLKSTMTNPSKEYLDAEFDEVVLNPDYDDTWGGDPQYLSERFVRFSYRFKFDDGEYSIIAPYTQICFIPKQHGYFNSTDAEEAYKSTIVAFMENDVAQIILNITFPTENPKTDLHISEVEILFKQSDSNNVKVVQVVPIDDVEATMKQNVLKNVYEFKYISTKPYRTIPADQSIRVYDKVPIKALSQEIISNRIVYGNYIDKHTSPTSLNYGLGYGLKSAVNPAENISYSQIEYPSSSVKQNRNYQVGVILSDRYGRQSSVILSTRDSGSTDGGGTILYGGSTIYVPYIPDDEFHIARDWPGYNLKALFINAPNYPTVIPTTGEAGYPGIYKDASYSVDGITLDTGGTGYTAGQQNVACSLGSGSGLTVDYTVVDGIITTATINNPGTGYQNGDLVAISGGTTLAVLALTVNPPNLLGWYSYKIVVRQTEQDYYNVYLPGILNGYPDRTDPEIPPIPPDGKTANIVLFNDNINKIPRDLVEVGPDQKQYRSSARVFGRVEPFRIGEGAETTNTTQYYPGTLADTAVSISTLKETNYIHGADILATEYPEFYQAQTNPLIARISTSKAIGKVAKVPPNDYHISLGVYETAPVESLLDIYWETSTVGLVSDLNNAVSQTFTGPAALKMPTTPYAQSESYNINGLVISNVGVVTNEGIQITTPVNYALAAVVTDFNNNNITDSFVLLQNPGTPSEFNIRTNNYFYYGGTSANDILNRAYTFYIDCYDAVLETTITLELYGALSNAAPAITTKPAGNELYIPNSAIFTFQFTGENGVNVNAPIAAREQGLTWSIVSVFLDGANVTATSGFALDQTGRLTNPLVDDATVEADYNIIIRLTDAGGLQEDYAFITKYYEAVSNKAFKSMFTTTSVNTYTIDVAFSDLDETKYAHQFTLVKDSSPVDEVTNSVNWPPTYIPEISSIGLTASCSSAMSVPAGYELIVSLSVNGLEIPASEASFLTGDDVDYIYTFPVNINDDNFYILARLLEIQVVPAP